MNLRNRKIVLSHTLQIESMVSIGLAGLLGKVPIDTLSFGNTSSALSFNQKVNLLIDIAALEKSDKAKFIALMEIRNQFMHNLEADTFESCCSFLPGKDVFLLKNYPQNSRFHRETQLRKAFNALAEDVNVSALHIILKVYNKIEAEVTQKTNKYVLDSMRAGSQKWDSEVAQYIKENLKNKTGKMSIRSVHRLITRFRRSLFSAINDQLNTKMQELKNRQS